MRKQGAFTQGSLWEIWRGREMGIWLKQRDRGPILQKKLQDKQVFIYSGIWKFVVDLGEGDEREMRKAKKERVT